MTRNLTYRLIGAAAVLLAGCEHATVPSHAVHPVPEEMFGQAVRGLEPAQLAVLMEMVQRAERDREYGALALPATGHPLAGLSVEQVQLLFSAAGVPATRYLPPGHPALRADHADLSGAR